MSDNGETTPPEEEQTDPLKCLFYALENHHEKVHISPLKPVILKMNMGKKNTYGTIKIAVDKNMIHNLRGDPDQCHLFMLIAVERDVVDEAEAPSPLIEPLKLIT